MPFHMHHALRCPLDQLPLQQVENSLCCPGGHSFDIARQGYVNLLGAQDKRSSDPGDSKAMISARHSFLQAGHYQPVAAKLNQLVLERIKADSLIVDAGCGEGYYLQSLAGQLQATSRPPPLLGFDISKWALQTAARRYPASWLVASNRAIPLADNSAGLVLSLFGFAEYGEFRRVLQSGGSLLQVNAGPLHLIELREIIYPSIKTPRLRDHLPAENAGFSLTYSETLSYPLPALAQASLAQLLAMTPHLFRASAQGKRRAAALTELALTVDVTFEVFQAK